MLVSQTVLIMLSVVHKSIMLCVVLLSVVMLNVVAPLCSVSWRRFEKKMDLYSSDVSILSICPGVNFANILQAAFSYKSFLHSCCVLTIWVCNFFVKGFWRKRCSCNVGEIYPRGLYHKTYYGRNLRISFLFVPDKPFQPSLMFAGKARAYPSEAPFRCSTLSLTHKH
jgi:hypothetical protein